jgi:hypothetical protein
MDLPCFRQPLKLRQVLQPVTPRSPSLPRRLLSTEEARKTAGEWVPGLL